MSPLTPVRNYYRRWFNHWLAKRIPAEQIVVLDLKRIFIFPSKAGFAYLGVVALLWLVAPNYQNNLIFAFAALLGAVFVVAIMHSYANLSGIRLRVTRVEPTFAGQKAGVELQLSQQGKRRMRDDLTFSFAGSMPVTMTLPGAEATAMLYVPTSRRGWLLPGRLTVESHYPLGLFRVWTHVLPACQGLVYPKPLPGQPVAVLDGVQGDTAEVRGQGVDDFVGLEKYRSGEPLNRVAWKHLARGRGMLSKHYGDQVSTSQWLDWQAFPGLDREARLSRLCQWLLEVSAGGDLYGLRLPGSESALDKGPRHRDQLLASLALFELQAPSGNGEGGQ